MAEVGEPERGAFDPLDQVVGRFGGGVGEMGSMPGGDLVTPAHESPPQRVDLDRVGPVLEIVAETTDELEGQVWVVMVVDASDDFLGVPGGADLAVRVAGVEQPQQSGRPCSSRRSSARVNSRRAR